MLHMGEREYDLNLPGVGKNHWINSRIGVPGQITSGRP